MLSALADSDYITRIPSAKTGACLTCFRYFLIFHRYFSYKYRLIYVNSVSEKTCDLTVFIYIYKFFNFSIRKAFSKYLNVFFSITVYR